MSWPQWYLMAASAAFTVDFRKGSVSRGNSSTTFTFQGSPSAEGAATDGVSATMPLSTIFFFVPAYMTVARASIISCGYNVMVFLLFVFLHAPLLGPFLVGHIDGHGTVGDEDVGVAALEGVAADRGRRTAVDGDGGEGFALLEG